MAGLSEKVLAELVNQVAQELEGITDEQAVNSDVGGDSDAEDNLPIEVLSDSYSTRSSASRSDTPKSCKAPDHRSGLDESCSGPSTSRSNRCRNSKEEKKYSFSDSDDDDKENDTDFVEPTPFTVPDKHVTAEDITSSHDII